jgi:hypothetical protein
VNDDHCFVNKDSWKIVIDIIKEVLWKI